MNLCVYPKGLGVLWRIFGRGRKERREGGRKEGRKEGMNE
jgi:hypothetical protein